MKKSKFYSFFSSIYSSLIFLFLYMPIVVLMVFSFNSSKSMSNWSGFTFDWYKQLFADSNLMNALKNTVVIAFSSAIIATLIGTFAAIGIYYLRNAFAKKLILNLTYLPMLNPDIVTGISLLLLFTTIGLTFGFKTLLLAHITFNIPYVVLSVLPKLRQMNPHSYEAALDLGMRPFPAVCRVMVPEIMPGIISGFLLALTLSIDDFVISYFTTGVGVSTLSIEIYTAAKRGIKPTINALSTIMFIVVLTLLLIVNLRKPKENSNITY